MIDLSDAIKQRRSIRKYKNKVVPVGVIKEIVKAAAWAPSAHNAQPWRFVILTNKTNKRGLAEVMAQVWLKELDEDGVLKTEREALVTISVNRFSKAPVLILACLTYENLDKYTDEKRTTIERDLAIQSLGAAIQNLLLMAHAKGLGACWFCAPNFCKQEIRKILEIPKEFEPQALITIGYADEKPKPPIRKNIENFAHKEKWGKLI